MTDNSADIQELIDRQRIWECMLRYTRGMDRLDRDLVLSAYHDDAWEDHGAMLAPGEPFADRVLQHHRDNEVRTQHILSNHSCEIDGNEAHAETYVHCYSLLPDGTEHVFYGRFADRLEKRDGRWGIVERVSIRDGAHDPNHHVKDHSLSFTRRDRSDPTYMRSLRIVRDFVQG